FANARFVYLCNPYATKGVFAVESIMFFKRITTPVIFKANHLFGFYLFFKVHIRKKTTQTYYG
ncbi:hypothetical protein, partial [Syntrophomonas wolfei]|uniref:hypothetical protein n=1 Tax=Syntrophomonas wolfei TaxID=863 RepID=UPI0023F0B86D